MKRRVQVAGEWIGEVNAALGEHFGGESGQRDRPPNLPNPDVERSIEAR